ncbi:sugar phosphate isomerase/epimerase [Paenibacillus psychroresistens]|uniref:Sugar phosphate isomerase/epimerase n=1 Tax=Paenibacillus psychroresistens TaxID=1778678 RepID=A0A6B8RUA2_9BACL|nr:sugar phosphate isomerase/epimerase [Paenibacillus psychroresistens]QGQ98748.1 sugar phosphate isomerase/epimerase [Paenibacillus psychroresistens]
MGKMEVGLQLYTLRDQMAIDLEGTLRHVAALGYSGVEFAGYFGRSAQEIRSLLDELNLKAIGSHIGLTNISENLQGEIDFIKTIGGSYFTCPSVPEEDRKDAAGWQSLYAIFQKTGEEVGKQGLQFCYHNHAFEFDIQVGDEFAFDALYQTTTTEAVKVELDVCWVQFAKQDVLTYIEKYKGRIPLLHLKDFTRDEQGQLKTLELGQGEVQLDQVIDASVKAGVKWLIVEQDSCQNPPLESIANSMNWLRSQNSDTYILR